MSKRAKPLSLEEKRKRFLAFFHETVNQLCHVDQVMLMLGDTFRMISGHSKNLRKWYQNKRELSIKEVLDGLVSDHLVVSEKIGTSNYFWSYPSSVRLGNKRKLNDLEENVTQLKAKKTKLTDDVQVAQECRLESEQREENIKKVAQIKKLNAELKQELSVFRDRDPEILEKKRQAVEVAKAAANRWTDNIFVLQSYLKNKFNFSSADFVTQFEIPVDLDNIP